MVKKNIFDYPERVIIFSFLFLIILGAFLLSLPISTNKYISFTDALFTSTSAVCVTGLNVFDTYKDFSLFGQLVIITLVQIGGIGIMTFSTLFILFQGKKAKFVDRIIIQDAFTYGRERTPESIIKKVLWFTFIIEFIGAALLFTQFNSEHSFLKSVYFSIFHSISAFCNAGFSLFSDSYIRFNDNLFFQIVTCVLVILGGLGFLVISEVIEYFKRSKYQKKHLSLHSKIVLTISFSLFFIGGLVIFLLEKGNALAQLPFTSQISNSFFMSAVSRTSGFNTINIADMSNGSLFFMIILMFIGGAPGSCAGGIKVTTFSVLFFLGLSSFQGNDRPQIFHRSFSKDTIDRAVGVFMVCLILIIISVMVLQITEAKYIFKYKTSVEFLNLLFETVSGFGTVGLSTGITSVLSKAGKLIIIFTMFAGRIGPLTIVLAISRRIQKKHYYPEEKIMIG